MFLRIYIYFRLSIEKKLVWLYTVHVQVNQIVMVPKSKAVNDGDAAADENAKSG